MPRTTALPAKDRSQTANTALGFISATSSVQGIVSQVAMTNQNLRATAVGLRAGDVVSNIIVLVQTAAAGTAGVVNVGLYDAAYNKVASSGDVNTNYTATGLISAALTSQYTVTSDGLFYPVWLMTTAYGTTQPSLGGTGINGLGNALGSNPRPNWVQAAQSSLPTTATPAANATALWFAVS